VTSLRDSLTFDFEYVTLQYHQTGEQMDLYDELNAKMDATYIEHEGADIRVDFDGNISVWFRKSPLGDEAEGTCPKEQKKSLSFIAKKFGYAIDAVEFV
jgi:hypothetical protein